MSTPVSQKHKYCDINRVFNEQWTMQFLFIKSNGKPLCLVSQEAISVVKEYKLKHHYKSLMKPSMTTSEAKNMKIKVSSWRNWCIGNKLLSQDLEGIMTPSKQVILLLKTLLKYEII